MFHSSTIKNRWNKNMLQAHTRYFPYYACTQLVIAFCHETRCWIKQGGCEKTVKLFSSLQQPRSAREQSLQEECIKAVCSGLSTCSRLFITARLASYNRVFQMYFLYICSIIDHYTWTTLSYHNTLPTTQQPLQQEHF